MNTATKTQPQTFYTFQTKGLTAKQISFLAECERLYFEGEKITFNLLKKALVNVGQILGKVQKQYLEAWEYWKTQYFAQDVKSIKNPISLSKAFTKIMPDNRTFEDSFYIRDSRENTGSGEIGNSYYYGNINRKYFEGLDMELIYELTPKNFYFEITQDGRLFIKYQQIIGSRFICQLK